MNIDWSRPLESWRVKPRINWFAVAKSLEDQREDFRRQCRRSIEARNASEAQSFHTAALVANMMATAIRAGL